MATTQFTARLDEQDIELFLISSINYTQNFLGGPHGCFFKMLAIY